MAEVTFGGLVQAPGGGFYAPAPPPAGYKLNVGPSASSGGFNPAGVLGLASSFLPQGDTRLAAQSLVVTGEPISTAVLSAGNFLLGKSSQSKQEKAARLAASFARDKNITANVSQFFLERLDASDPETGKLFQEAQAALANTEDKIQGQLTYDIKTKAGQLLVNQAIQGRAIIPTTGDPESIAEVWKALGQRILSATGKTLDDLFGAVPFEQRTSQDVYNAAKVLGLSTDQDAPTISAGGVSISDVLSATSNATPGSSSPSRQLLQVTTTSGGQQAAGSFPMELALVAGLAFLVTVLIFAGRK